MTGADRLPLFLVTGVRSAAMARAALRLQLDLADCLSVHVEFDPESRTVQCTASDLSQVVERHELRPEHCLTCTVRDGLLATVNRLARRGRWRAVVAHLPVGVDGTGVCRVLANTPRKAPRVRLAGVVAAVHGPDAVDDLVGDDLLVERDEPVMPQDRRGVAEVMSAIVEYADIVTLGGTVEPAGLELTHRLARPGALVCQDWPRLEHDRLVAGIHDHRCTEAWAAQVPDGPTREAVGEHVWTLDLRADRPLHPQRLHDRVEDLGAGHFRTRGRMWLSSRPDAIGVWDGSGGQVSLGANGRWGTHHPHTRILVTGLLAEDAREPIRAAFAQCLLTDAELARRGPWWDVEEDGLEPWLGPIREPAPEF